MKTFKQFLEIVEDFSLRPQSHAELEKRKVNKPAYPEVTNTPGKKMSPLKKSLMGTSWLRYGAKSKQLRKEDFSL